MRTRADRIDSSLEATGAVVGFVGGIVVFSAIMIPMLLIHAFVLTIVWGWFVVPFGLPEINVAWAVGLCVIVAVIKDPPPKKSEKTSGWVVLSLLARPWLLLLIAYIAKQFM